MPKLQVRFQQKRKKKYYKKYVKCCMQRIPYEVSLEKWINSVKTSKTSGGVFFSGDTVHSAVM